MLIRWKIKPLSPIRSSDRRKIADQIISSFDIEVPIKGNQEENASIESPATISVGDVRNSLLPDGSLSARFTTTKGANLNQVSGTVYVGAHPGCEQRILWINIEGRLIPTGWWL